MYIKRGHSFNPRRDYHKICCCVPIRRGKPKPRVKRVNVVAIKRSSLYEDCKNNCE